MSKPELNHAALTDDIIVCNGKPRAKIGEEWNAWVYYGLESLKSKDIRDVQYRVKCPACLDKIYGKRKPLKVTKEITI